MGATAVKGRTWAELDASALRRNLARVRSRAGERRVIAVIKANAYGHGAVEVARVLVQAGAEALAVATLAEASELREAGLTSPVLLLGGVSAPEEARGVAALDLWPLVSRLDSLDALEAAAAESASGRVLDVHLTLDTGMTRLGLDAEMLGEALASLERAEHLRLAGLATHLACADEPDRAPTDAQRARFESALRRVRERGFEPDWIHADNSAGVVHGPTPGTNAVRPGIALYGADPTLERGFPMEPVMALRTRVVHERRVPAGTRVGYGGTFAACRETQILTLPIGYADGLPRAAGNHYEVAVRGQRMPLVGRVSMDFATVDAGPDAHISVGQEVLVFGREGGDTVGVEELADATGTISYEILVGIGSRVPRLWGVDQQWASPGSELERTPRSRSADD